MNPEITLTLDEAVGEVLGILTGLDLTYDPTYDRYRAITRQLNRALRANALEHEWSWYASTTSVGTAACGEWLVWVPSTVRPRITGDDAVRLVDSDGVIRAWAYFLPRDAIHKYGSRQGLWCAVTKQTLQFSRPFEAGEQGLDIQVPVMREPTMFRLPPHPEDPEAPLSEVPDEVRQQPIDFWYPDVIISRAAYYVAMTDPVIQPRAQTLEAEYKDIMYQIIERDDRNTDSPYINDFDLGISGSINGDSFHHPHPHSGFAERG